MKDAVYELGLDTPSAISKLEAFGANELPQPKTPGVLTVFVLQFKSPFIYILFAAAVVSMALGQTINAYFIFAVLMINASIGTFQEYAAERAANALRGLVPHNANVVRDGRVQQIKVADVVPDDILILESGDKIAADIVLLDVADLIVDESMLTGESAAILKSACKTDTQEAPAEQRGYAGTIVTRGRGVGRVTATGADTEIGKIAEEVGAETIVKPPLITRIERFTLIISYAMLVIIALMFAVTVARGDELSSVFLLGVALAVSAIPEGLPAAITVALAIGMRRMAKVNVIIRKLAAVEALGSCTFIASDKTGTLTINEMTVKRLLLPNGHTYTIENDHASIADIVGQATVPDDSATIERLVLSGALANEAVIEHDGQQLKISGDEVDAAFLNLAMKVGHDVDQLRRDGAQVDSIPYESENAYSASFNRDADESCKIHVKGALETLLTMCRDDALDKARFISLADELAADGYRVLGVASATYSNKEQVLHDGKPTGLELLGVVGIVDPLRPEAIRAIIECRKAQVEGAMVTGDHPGTALAIARELGLAGPDDKAVTGAELAAAAERGEAALEALVREHRVFARISPTQKRTIVEHLMNLGHNVAVTGDGVNDAPALHHAHVGVAMGKRGTDVARESADLILTDDNFASIVNGIREGRIVYNNIRKVIFLLISTGAAEITLFLWSLSMGLPLPLLPIQLLWLNLVTNGVQDVALAFEPAEGNELGKPPRAPNEPIFDRLMIERVVINAIYMGTLAFAIFYAVLQTGVSDPEARNITLLLMVLFENVHALNSRSEERSLFRMPFFSNPLLILGIFIAQTIHIGSMYLPGISAILEIEPVSFATWAKLLLVATTLVVLDETHKLYLRKKESSNLADVPE